MSSRIGIGGKIITLDKIARPKYSSEQKQKNWYNPQSHSRDHLSKTRPRSIFLTQFDKMQRTKALWRNLQPQPKHTQIIKSVSSWVDLNRLKIQYRTQLLRRKSKDQIFQENMEMIMKIEEVEPQVDAWNLYKPKRSKRSSSEELMQKNLQLIKRIQQAQPKIQNWNYLKPKKSPRNHKRSQQKLKIFEQNLKLITMVESAAPKVDAWSYIKPQKNNKFKRQRSLEKEKLFQENMKIIERVQSVEPKIESWADIKSMRRRIEHKKKNETASTLKLDRLKKIIQASQSKLLQKQHQAQQNRRTKTLPDRLPPKLLKQQQSANEKSKMMQLKVQKSKCAIECWSKQISARNKISRNSPMKKNMGILARAQQARQLKYRSKYQEVPLKIDGVGKKY